MTTLNPPLPPVVDMIGELVALPSISSSNPALDQSNSAVCERLANWLEPMGFACELMPLPEQPHKCNLIATLGQGPGGLVLAGHADTVPYDQGAWQSDPFVATRRDDALVGLGTCDMKGFLAIAADAARAFAGKPLAAPLTILATADEETGMEGARCLVESSLTARRGGTAIIGEPTGGRPVRAHKGILMEAIHLHGRAGHSSNPATGANTIEALAPVLTALRELQRSLAVTHNDPLFDISSPTLNPGHVCGGDAPNRIPAATTLHIDLRFLPGMQLDTLRMQVRDAVTAAVESTPCTVSFEPLFEGAPAFCSPATAGIVEAAEALTGHSALAVDFATEAPFLDAIGLQTVVLGPGDISVAHQPDECLPLNRIAPTTELLQRMIQRWCVDSV